MNREEGKKGFTKIGPLTSLAVFREWFGKIKNAPGRGDNLKKYERICVTFVFFKENKNYLPERDLVFELLDLDVLRLLDLFLTLSFLGFGFVEDLMSSCISLV